MILTLPPLFQGEVAERASREVSAMVGNSILSTRIMARFLAALLALVFASLVANAMQIRTELAKTPLKSITITLGQDALDSFLETIRSADDTNYFAIRMDPIAQSNKIILLQMWRDDIHIIGSNSVHDPKTFHLSLYATRTVEAISPGAIESVLASLKAELSKVGNVEISEPRRY